MKFLPVLTFTATALLSSTLAFASSMTTFDYTNLDPSEINVGATPNYADSINMDREGINLEVSAWSSSSPQNSIKPNWTRVSDPYGISMGNHGLGVKSSFWDSAELDGAGQLESLLFSFTPSIELVSITFEHFYNREWIIARYFLYDDFNLTVDGVLKLSDTAVNSSFFSPLTFAMSEKGNEFRVWADHFSDDFRISSFDVVATPIPAGVWLFGTAIFGLVSLRQCTQKAS